MPSSLVPWKSCGRFALLAAFGLDPHATKSVVSKCLATNSLLALRPIRRRSRNIHGMRNNRSRTSSSQFACALPLPRSATCQPKHTSEPFRRLQQPLVGLQEHSQRVPPPRLEQLAWLLLQQVSFLLLACLLQQASLRPLDLDRSQTQTRPCGSPQDSSLADHAQGRTDLVLQAAHGKSFQEQLDASLDRPQKSWCFVAVSS